MQPRRNSVKDLELPTFPPSPKVYVSTWIDRVDLALKGAEESGRGKWTDFALYYMLGNKLMENAARWWVNMNRQLPKRKRTWTLPHTDDEYDGTDHGDSRYRRTRPTYSHDGQCGFRKNMEHAALFTNPQGVYNVVTGTWDPPPGHVWNGKYWYEPKKAEQKRTALTLPASDRTTSKKTAKVGSKREIIESSSDELDAKPRKKKLKAAVEQTSGTKRRVETMASEEIQSSNESRPNRGMCFQCDQHDHWSTDDEVETGEGGGVARTGEGAESQEPAMKMDASTGTAGECLEAASLVLPDGIGTAVECTQTAAALKLNEGMSTSETNVSEDMETFDANAKPEADEDGLNEVVDEKTNEESRIDIDSTVAEDDDVQCERVARRQARRSAKRERAKAWLARKKRRERDETAEQQRVSE
ncbi:unnamed protein product [Phytophthora fragariaefolia]|uniref:Unnamed protein product n=1 Tax=Phytophthora fragariaefolia TaxID=1490495 RepID=A0A9W6XE66_9STRA|nr:unnamed protein product [Phytophthora fragariaefolia]